MFESTARRPKGYITLVEPNGKLIEADSMQCVHCGGHFQVIKGSGKRRGFCLKCMGTTCGSLACDACIPFEKQLGIMER